MTDIATSQGRSPVAGVVGSAFEQRRSISADSFRKLTALLKKETPPELGLPKPMMPVSAAPAAPVFIPLVEPAHVGPVVVAAPPPMPVPIAPVAVSAAPPTPIVPTIIPAATPPLQATSVIAPVIVPTVKLAPILETAVPAIVDLPDLPREIDHSEIRPIANYQPEVCDSRHVEPEKALASDITEPHVRPVATPDIHLAFVPEPVLVPVLHQTSEPIVEPISAPKAVAPAPGAETQVQPTLRITPRDAFAASPTVLPARAPTPVVQQTPQQEQESAELARSLLDMMASGSAAGLPQERALAADTLLRMLPRLPVRSLISLSERVKLMEAPPTLLMAKLIADTNISVAGPLLEDCMHITDEDLAMVIGEGDYAKIRLIARRRRLSRAITNELVKTGDDSVLLTLIRNQGAEIPQESFLMLAEFAKDYPDLLAPLCTRPDLPVPLAFELFWLAPVQLRRYLLSRFLTDSETLTKILKITRVTDGDEAVAAASQEQILAATDALAEGDRANAAVAFATYANINAATAERILADQSGEPMAAMLKAAGLARGQVVDVFQRLQASPAGMIDRERNTDELQSTFDSLSHNKARILLTYWDWATLKTGPYAPLN
ncbi:MAG: DUF2336 domain-containing protein [Alphaproteobacteria bacterium]|nr:DUF2336 domain-containing protein [Alphaproteobacteria bacterium]